MEIYNEQQDQITIGKDKTGQTVYVITGTTDQATAEAFAIAQIPVIDFGLILDRIALKEVEDSRDGMWRATAHYKRPEFEGSASGSSQEYFREKGFSFEITSATAKVTHSKETVQTYKRHVGVGDDPPSFDKAINVRDGKPEGVDIYIGEMAFAVEVEFPADAITNELIQTIENKKNHTPVNNAPFRGREAGEVFFEGVRGAVDYDDPISTLSYSFKVSKNATDVPFGPFTISKKGWEYAWIYEEEEEIDGIVRMSPRVCFVERLYDTGPFDDMGIQP